MDSAGGSGVAINMVDDDADAPINGGVSGGADGLIISGSDDCAMAAVAEEADAEVAVPDSVVAG